MRQTPTAMPLVDALKAFACLTIVIHHLCFYGPLTDAVRPWRPGLISFCDESPFLTYHANKLDAGERDTLGEEYRAYLEHWQPPR